ncbi:hypothetical protein C8R44DRAFT_62487 [Mycena epipterygia]|nr:hypothetical protein C8R44DRAFT_62487 [Mycena epipterygia]
MSIRIKNESFGTVTTFIQKILIAASLLGLPWYSIQALVFLSIARYVAGSGQTHPRLPQSRLRKHGTARIMSQTVTLWIALWVLTINSARTVPQTTLMQNLFPPQYDNSTLIDRFIAIESP